MITYIVELFGISSDITELPKVEVELKEGANLGDMIAVLKCKIPALEGSVIRAGEDRLTEYYAFNINGRFYSDDRSLKLKSGDRIALLALAIGG